MPLPSVRTVGRAVDVWVAVLRSWRFSEGDQPRCTPGRPSAWRPASSSPCTAFATCPAAMLRVIAAVARSTRGLRGGGRGATDLIAASAYWISARDQFALIFPLLPVADVKAGFKVSGCLSLIEGSDRSLWPRCCRSICRHRRPLRSAPGHSSGSARLTDCAQHQPSSEPSYFGSKGRSRRYCGSSHLIKWERAPRNAPATLATLFRETFGSEAGARK